ncbi:MAG: Asp-tRNA(Asn)/Glu-tRNA(Gln) amidotransferase subunit GatA [Acidobacteria bacterium]|nr:Asp-tRNA(Asn)/Glu-tRNA(Gln) amidotransferase subunit GatA [Acidobacteriota bacterium]
MVPLPPDAAGLREAIARHDVSAADVCRSHLDRIGRADAALGAFLTVAGEQALAQAALLDRGAIPIEAAPLLGVPVAVKDNICTRGIRTTAGSRMLDRFVPPYDATVVRRLARAGAVVIGKTNCDEFAMGSSTENSAFGPSRNPWAADRTPGGSSGGSAVAVSARMAPLALGSDTGGSIRQPAAFCGIVGLKPSYGRVSRFGLIAFASSLDQVGPLARTARDAALVLQAIAGPDPYDATASHEAVPDYTRALTGDIRALRIGVPRDVLAQGIDPEVHRRVTEALEICRARGAFLVDIDLPHSRFGIPVYYLVATAEASSNLARYDGVRYGYRAPLGEPDLPRDAASEDAHDRTLLRRMYDETRAAGFGAEVKRRIMLGTYVLSAGYYEAYYLKAQQVRTLIRQDFDQAFARVDVVAMPTSPTPPFRLGERVQDPLQMYLADVLTVGASLAGLPAISVPCGFTAGGLPVGLQLVGRMFDEATLLRATDAFERDTAWWKMDPPGAAA